MAFFRLVISSMSDDEILVPRVSVFSSNNPTIDLNASQPVLLFVLLPLTVLSAVTMFVSLVILAM